MQISEQIFETFFEHRLPRGGFTIRETYRGLIDPSDPGTPELAGHVVTMDGQLVIPQLRPGPETRRDEYLGDDLSWEDVRPGPQPVHD